MDRLERSIQISERVQPRNRALAVAQPHLLCLARALRGVHVDSRLSFKREPAHFQKQFAAEKVGTLRSEEDANAAVRCSVPAVEQREVRLQLAAAEPGVELVQLAWSIYPLGCLADGDAHHSPRA